MHVHRDETMRNRKRNLIHIDQNMPIYKSTQLCIIKY